MSARQASKTMAPTRPAASPKKERSAIALAKPRRPPPTKPSKASALSADVTKPKGAPLAHSRFDALRLMAETFADLQRARVSVGNRLGSSQVDQEITGAIFRHAQVAEDVASLAMRRAFRTAAPTVAAWVKQTHGLGEHLMVRLLGAIGDPAVANPYHWEIGKKPKGHTCNGHCGKTKKGEVKHLVADLPYRRSVSQLWSFCGHGDPTRRYRDGMNQDEAFACGNPHAKMLVHLMAECCMKAGGLYRDVYDVARINYQSREGWTLGHQHNAALRKVGKEILRDLWIVANDGGRQK